jgi:O-antigen ligase
VDPKKAVTRSFYEFTGRTTVWSQGMELFRSSPIIGNGFHAGRLVLNTHLHNGVVHSLVQTGILGTIAYLGAALYGWFLLYRVSRNLFGLSLAHKHLVIQSGAVLAFLTMRAFPESTAAFFGVDWLLLAPVLIYLYLVDSRSFASERL